MKESKAFTEKLLSSNTLGTKRMFMPAIIAMEKLKYFSMELDVRLQCRGGESRILQLYYYKKNRHRVAWQFNYC
jgi:hypothetical protein